MRLATALPRRSPPALRTRGGLIALLLAAGILLLAAGRHLGFFYDEWDFLLGRRGGTLSTYLDPHNGHLYVVAVAIYKTLFATVGVGHYWPYRLLLVLAHLACGALLYALARPRLGARGALLPAAGLLFLGSAYEDLLWPFQVGFLASIALGLAALILLERRDARADRLVALCLTAGIAASSVGVAFLVAAAAMLAAQRASLRRAWMLVLPVVLYGLWYVGWGTSEHVSVESLLGAPRYIAQSASAALAGLSGLPGEFGPPLCVATVLGLLATLGRGRPAPSPLAAGATAGALAFWGLTAVARAQEAAPGSSRYLYVGAVFLLLLLVEALGNRRAPRTMLLPLAGLALGVLLLDVGAMRDGERGFRATDERVRAALAAVEVAAPVVSPAFVADPAGAPQAPAGPYLAAVRDIGSPTGGLDALRHAPGRWQSAADGVLLAAERVTLVGIPAPGPRTQPPDARVSTGLARAVGRCTALTPAAAGVAADLELSPGTALVVRPARQTVAVWLRRFAPGYQPTPFARTTPGLLTELRLPTDAAPRLPWAVHVESLGAFEVCRA